MEIKDIKFESLKSEYKISAKVTSDINRKFPKRLWFKVPIQNKDMVTKTSNPFIISLLILAIKYGEDIYLDGIVSKGLIRNLNLYIKNLADVSDKFHKINIFHKGDTIYEGSEQKTAVSLTGGVDSLHLLKTNFEKIDYCLYVLGLDIKLNNKKTLIYKKKSMHDISDNVGKEILFVKTNIRNFTDIHLKYSHIVFLLIAGSASVYSPLFNKYIYPMAFTKKQQEHKIYGSADPSLYKFISFQGFKFKQGPSNVKRVDKTALIADWIIAQNHLQICIWQDSKKFPNCCTCAKCVRTMTTLKIIGKLKKFKTFNKGFSKVQLLKTPYITISDRKYMKELYQFAMKHQKLDIAFSILLARILSFPLYIVNKKLFDNRIGRKILGLDLVKKTYLKVTS